MRNLLNAVAVSHLSNKCLTEESERFNNARLRISNDYPWLILNALTTDLEQFMSPEDFKRIKNLVRSRSIESLSGLVREWGPQCISSVATKKQLGDIRARLSIVSLLKKFPFKEGSDELRTTAAMKKFILAEINCNNYNKRGFKEFSHSDEIHVKAIFSIARAWIQEVIGNELPDHKDLTLRSRHGPGSTTSTSGGLNSAYFKYAEWPYDVTSDCLEHAITLIKSDERWLGALEDSYRQRYGIHPCRILDQTVFWKNVFNIVPGNKIAFVPKSFDIHRTIAIEPTMNLLLQLGVDGFIRKRLKRWLIDIDDQSINQEFARLGSLLDALEDAFATLDLAMASDSIALRLVRELCPLPWYTYLMSLRSPSGRLKYKDVDRTIQYEKISSMGNGYTFALETLIFAAICFAVSKYKNGKFAVGDLAVYGDDIIVRKNDCALTIEMLQRAGFTINSDKSFTKGPFRESCGADWFHGQPVRAVYLSSQPQSVKDLYSDYNRITRMFKLFFYDFEPVTVQKTILAWLPLHLRVYGPYSDTEFDTYLHSARPPWPNSTEHGNFVFLRLIQKSQYFHGKRVNKLHFRKLMARLLPGEVPNLYSDKLEATGQAFDVPRPRAFAYALTSSTCDFWQAEYSHAITRRKDRVA